MALSKFMHRIASLPAEDIPVTLLPQLLKASVETESKALGIPSQLIAGLNGGPIQVEQQVDWKTLLGDPEARKALETLAKALDSEE